MDWLNSFLPNIPYPLKVAVLIILGLLIVYLFFRFFFKRIFKKINSLMNKIAIPFKLLYGPSRFLFPAIALLVVLSFVTFSEAINAAINHFLIIWFIIGFAWLILRVFAVLITVILNRYKLDVKDNLKARQINTQLRIIQRVVGVIVFVIATSAILMTFEEIRQIGVSILASAGIAGIIIGFAAQRSLGTLIAGIQVAITQPIRTDDVVIIENEWGRIEEITLTYAVVSIWDQRRLIVPITYFLEKPFQNWTRRTAELLGTVYIYADYSVPVDELRTELTRIVTASELWDQRLAKLQITNLTEKTVELRALISAENSSNAWELRCLVREKLIDFLQLKYPDKLPRVRLESDSEKKNGLQR